MTAPQSYDGISLVVDSDMLNNVSNQLIGGGVGGDGVGMLGHIMDNVLAIEQIMSDLKLGWAGQTSDEAKAFMDKWNAAMTALFGSKDMKNSGSLVRVAMALQGAAFNYANATDGVMSIFQVLADDMAPSTSQSDPTQTIWPPAVWTTEASQGAVSEVF
jgi:hypothetical protein